MSAIDLKTLCTALGFTAVVIQQQDGKFPAKDAALRAHRFANLIEEFCATDPASPGAPLEARDAESMDSQIEQFESALTRDGAACLPHDRPSLIAIYDRLLQRHARHERKHFYDTANDDMIANDILGMIDREIEDDTAQDDGLGGI